MNAHEPDQIAPDHQEHARLESWKEIGIYLQRDARTARRWELEEGLPVHRHSHKSRSSVYAYPSEIDAWRLSRKVVPEPELAPVRTFWRIPTFALAILLCLVMVGNGIRPQAASAKSGPLAKRLVCSDCSNGEGHLSRDGRWIVYPDYDSGHLATRDLFTGQVKRLLKFDSASGDIEGPVLSPDRRQIVFAWYTGENGHYQLRLVPNEPGSMPRVLIDSPEYSYYDASEWFPDGKSVLVLLVEKTEGTAQLARVSVSDGAIKVLKRLESRLYSAGNTGRVSPDGQHIVFSAWAVNPSKTPPAPSDPKDQHIYILSADGSRETEIIKTAGINRNPVWTADNKHILFTSDRSGKTDVWSIGVQDGQAVGAASLVSSDIGDVHAAGMARGSFYYTVIRRGDYIHIAGSAPGSARQAESIIGIRPAWSPDGKSLAFKRHRPGGSADDYDLVVHSLETGDERNYFSSLGAAGNGAATWFHDGLGILAGLRRGDGSRAFYRIDLKTGEYKELVKLVGPNVLSPDDRTLYLLPINTPDPGVRNRVVAVDLTTGQERVIATLPQPASSISLSPDGRTLALGWLAGAPTDAKLHIARVSVDGSGFREVFTRPDHLFGPGNVAWDRDGHSLLFTQEQPEGATHWGVMRVPAEGGGPATLVFPASNIQSYDLSPDGSRIAYSSNESATELWALDNVLPMLK